MQNWAISQNYDCFTQDDPEIGIFKKLCFYQSLQKIILWALRIGKIIVKGTEYAIYTFCTFPYKTNGISLGLSNVNIGNYFTLAFLYLCPPENYQKLQYILSNKQQKRASMRRCNFIRNMSRDQRIDQSAMSIQSLLITNGASFWWRHT